MVKKSENNENIKLVVLRVTGNCNLRCRYCYACGGDSREDMSWAIARKAIDYAALPGNSFKVQFTGGEPLLNLSLIKKIVAYTRNKRIAAYYQMQTNGTLITPQIAAELKKMRIAIGISLDGMPDVNDYLRPFAGGHGSTLAVLHGLSNLGAAGVKVGLTAVLTKHNITGLPQLVELAGYTGNVYGIAFDLLRPLGRAGANNILPPAPAVMEKFVRTCLRRAGEIASMGGNPVKFRDVERLKRQLSRRLARRHYCYATTGQSLAVMPKGDVYPCSSLAGQPEFYIGNITAQDFSLSPGMARLSFLRREVSDLDGCRECPDHWLCGGGCLARAYAYTGRVDRPYPGDCLLKKVFIQYVKEKSCTNPHCLENAKGVNDIVL